MTLRPRLGLRVFVSGDDRFYWSDGSSRGIFSGRFAGRLMKSFLAPSGPKPILASLLQSDERTIARATLDRLLDLELLHDESLAAPAKSSLEPSEITPLSVQRKNANDKVTILGRHRDIVDALRRHAADIGILPTENAEVTIVATESYRDASLENELKKATRRGGMFIPAMIGSRQIWAGPAYTSKTRPCWKCFQARVAEHAWVESQLPAEGWRTAGSPLDPEWIDSAAEMAVHKIADAMLAAPSTSATLWTFDRDDHGERYSVVLPTETCLTCNATEILPTAATDSIDPDDLREPASPSFLRALDRLAAPITGIAEQLRRIDLIADPPVYSWGAQCHITLPPPSKRIPGGILRPAVCSGRGWTPKHARIACIAEVVERYSSQYSGQEHVRFGSYRDFRDDAIHPDFVQLFSEAQFRKRDAWNACHSSDEAIPEPFAETEPIEWVEGSSLLEDRRRLLPLALCYRNYRPKGRRWIGDADSNGCAAGASRTEAILHALLELIERDARAIWWFNQLAAPRISLESIDHPGSRRVLAALARENWSVALHDITTDIGVPVITATASSPEGWIRGSGAHVSATGAARNAIAELWQLSRTPPRTHPLPALAGSERPIEATPAVEFSSLEKVVGALAEKLRSAGSEAIVFDLTRRGIDIPVVRVVAPGLRHKKPRFAPGRLFDVPVKMGWLARPIDEEQMPAVAP